jgi:PhoPQ-activated pathogenicity-related protein
VNRRDRLLRQVHLQRFIVTLTSGETFDGLLADADDNSVKLVGAFAIDERSRESVDGDLYLPRAKIAYMQNPGGRP